EMPVSAVSCRRPIGVEGGIPTKATAPPRCENSSSSAASSGEIEVTSQKTTTPSIGSNFSIGTSVGCISAFERSVIHDAASGDLGSVVSTVTLGSGVGAITSDCFSMNDQIATPPMTTTRQNTSPYTANAA